MTRVRSFAWFASATAIVTIAVVAFAARSCSETEAAPSADATRTDDDHAAPPAATFALPNGEPTTRREANAPPRALQIESWLDHPYAMQLEVVQLDSDGLPCEGETVEMAPHDLPRNVAPERTDSEGRTVVTWRSRTPTGEIVVADRLGMLVRVPVRHGHRTRLALCGTDIARIAGTLGLRDARITFSSNVVESSRDRVMQAVLHPYAVFGADAGLVPEPQEGAGNPNALDIADAIGTGSLAFAIEAVTNATKTVDAKAAVEAPSIGGTVFGEDGRPATKTPVVLLGSSPQPLHRVTTDDDGRFVFENCVEGTFTVRAGGNANGLGTTTAVVTRGRTPARVDLRRDTCIRGRIVRTDHGPATPYRVVWRAEDGTACDETTTADDDTFVFANLPAVPGNVFAWPNSSTGLPVAFAMHVLGDNGELVLRHDNAAQHRISFEPLLPDDCSTAPIDARIWQLDTGLGAEVMHPEPGKPWEIPYLVPGWYRLEVQAPGCGFVDLGRQWLDGKTDVDLGRIELPRPGRVTFVIPEAVVPEKGEHRAFQIVAIRRDLDVRTILDEIPTDRPMFLPAGDYAFAYRHREGDVRFVKFTVRSGEATVVTAQ